MSERLRVLQALKDGVSVNELSQILDVPKARIYTYTHKSPFYVDNGVVRTLPTTALLDKFRSLGLNLDKKTLLKAWAYARSKQDLPTSFQVLRSGEGLTLLLQTLLVLLFKEQDFKVTLTLDKKEANETVQNTEH